MGDAFQEPLWRQVLSGAQMLFVAFGASGPCCSNW